MIHPAYAVIGANYGDEGKGRTVDLLARRLGPGTLVVRSNGGAQAGHSVVTPDGRAHVFHHLGSGALAGAATHLSRFIVSHPMLLADEVRVVAALGGTTRITADGRGFVTTPWDMMVNQAAELARGGARHGSCGLGFGETVGRCEETPYVLTVADLRARDLHDRLRVIRDCWLPARLAALGLAPPPHAGDQALLDRFLADVAAFNARVDLRADETLGDAPLVVEAAQGLLLDQHGRDFPHVTRSNTGIANIAALARGAGIGRVDAVYTTRCYLTRHGRGPMTDERAIDRWFAVDDPTNRPNPWQETLRFGLLDVAALAAAVDADAAAAADVTLVRHAAVTCLDQARGGLVRFLDGGAERVIPADRFAALVGERLGAATVIGGWGRSASVAASARVTLISGGNRPSRARRGSIARHRSRKSAVPRCWRSRSSARRD